ncbi:MAG: hypothetical protein ACKPKO_13380 [Candidatus Fonsibacter sp.]
MVFLQNYSSIIKFKIIIYCLIIFNLISGKNLNFHKCHLMSILSNCYGYYYNIFKV